MKKQVKRGKTTYVVNPPEQPKHTGYGIMVLAIAVLGIVILLLNISEGKRDIQRQNIITGRLVMKYESDVTDLNARIADLKAQLEESQAQLLACQSPSIS